MLELDNVTVERAGTPVLRDVSACLEPGKITAICGPNGAGKSTMLEALAGLILPTSGDATYELLAIAHHPPRLRAQIIGYLPQHGEAAWDVSVRNLVALGRMPYGDMATGPIDAAIDALELHALADRPISELSGGEKARAHLARVLAGDPAWILADEPLAALDLAHQLALLKHLKREAKNGIGVVIVLHDLALAMNHADRVIVLDNGRLAADGDPPDALSAEIVADVWGVAGEWLGESGARALVTH